LDGACFHKRLLHGVKLAIAADAFYGQYFSSMRSLGWYHAAHNGLAI
jgi:hypothetical protein